MISRFFLLSLLAHTLIAGSVTNQNIYEKDNSVDIMFTFDTPYEGKITRKKDGNNAIFILDDTGIEKQFSKKIDSYLIQKLELIPYQNKLYIELYGLDEFDVDASKTVDHYGLRLRITPKEALSTLQKEAFHTKKEEDMSSAFSKVMLILLGLFGLLYFLKRRLMRQGSLLPKSWLFNQKKSEEPQSTLTILERRRIDMQNQLLLLSFRQKEYLLLMGNSNVLLETYDKRDDHTAFDQVLSENEEQLNDFIRLKNKKFDTYKKKISLDDHS